MWECRINKFRVINMDSGTESLPLRRAVWIAEKPRCILLKIAGNRRNCAGFAVKPDWRKCPAGPRSQAFERFSRLGTCAVRFHSRQLFKHAVTVAPVAEVTCCRRVLHITHCEVDGVRSDAHRQRDHSNRYE